MTTPTFRSWAPPLIATTAVCTLWLGRETMSIDVIARLALPVAWITIWTAACLGIGRPVVLCFNRNRKPAPELCLALAAGAAALSLIATILATVNLFRPGVLAAVLAAATISGIVQAVTIAKPVSWPEFKIEPVSAVLVVAAWGGLVAVLSTPPVMFDVAHYHLAFPSQWLDAGTFAPLERHGFSYYPFGHGMLYGYALATVGPWGASALHWWFGAVAALCAGSLASRLGGPRAGWWALAIFALTPAALEIAAFAISDLVVACWAGAAFVALLGTDARHPRPALAGALAGSAFSAKYLALATVALPLAVAALLYYSLNGRRSWRPWVALALGAAVTAGPWVLRNIVATGNPVFPYFSTVLGGPESAMNLGVELRQNDQEQAGPLRSALRAVTAPAYRTFKPLRQGGLFGLAWVLLLTSALFLRAWPLTRWGPPAAATIVGCIAWGGLVHFARFLLPVLVPAAALAGAAAAALATLPSAALRRTFVGLLLGLLAWNTTVIGNQLNFDRVGVAIGLIDDDSFRKTWMSYSPALDFINLSLPNDAVILLVAEPRSLYIEREVVVEDSYRQPLLLELAGTVNSTDALAAKVAELGITHLMVNEGHMTWSAHLRFEEAYWDGGAPGAHLRVLKFLEHHTERMYESRGIWVGRLRSEALQSGG